jgi:hypothetical protein
MRFTAANAREMAAKSHAARLQRLASQAQAADIFSHTSQGGPHDAADDYVSRRLVRVRVQLDQLDAAITRETAEVQPDGQRLNWLAGAQERLADQERILAGRPLPGSRRPEKDRPARTFAPGAWLDISAPPQVVAQVEAPRLQDPAQALQVASPCPSCASDTPTGSVLPDNPMPSMPQDAAKP